MLYRANPIIVGLGLMLFLMMHLGCKNETTTETKVADQKPLAQLPQVEPQPVEKSNQTFLQHVEAQLCLKYKDKMKDCYLGHANALKSDFLNQMPITLNKPYDAPIDWDYFKKASDFEKIWSYKCGFQDKNSGRVINYYCPNVNSEFGVWLDSLSLHNDLIRSFNMEYKKTENFSPQYQQSMYLQAETDLDFDDEAVRRFYWIYHFGLADVRHASEAIKN